MDTLTDRQAEDALRLLNDDGPALDGSWSQGAADDESEASIAALPEGWGTTLTGEPMPDVAAAVRRSRETH